MSDYTKVNLREVEDSAPKFGLGSDLQARFARRDLDSSIGGVSLMRLAPNARSPFGHRHAEQEEVYVVVDGSGRVKLGDEIVDLQRWDAIRVAPETIRAFEAGAEGLEFVAFGAPIAEGNDAEIVQGWWS